MTHQQQITLRTTGHGHMHDLTGQVAAIVSASGIGTGTVNVFNVGSTAAIGAIEFEPGLERDLPELLDKLFRPAGTTAMSRHGTTATGTPTCKQLCWDSR